MKKIFTFLFIFLLLSTPGYAKTGNLTDKQIREIIKNGVEWMKNAQETSGHFRYEYAPFWDRTIDDDNIVRQTGALYILGEVAVNMSEENIDLQATMENALRYLSANSIEAEFNGYTFKCLLKTPEYCTLGGTSLTLVGLLDLIKAYPSLENKYRDSIEAYKNFILAMRIPEKGFRDQYFPQYGDNQNTNESPFSNGEALLALVRYDLQNSSDEVQQTIEDSLEYFITLYQATWDVNFYLWGMAALKDWYKVSPDQNSYDFVKNYTDWRIQGQQKSRKSSTNKCAYIEGVVSAYSILKHQSKEHEKEKYQEEINFWLKQSSVLQIKKEDQIRILFKKSGKKMWQSKILDEPLAVS